MLRLDGKVALVTGCGTHGEGWGNGKAISVLLARQGAKFWCRLESGCCQRNPAHYSRRRRRGACDGCQCHGCYRRERMVDACIEQYGRIDILINNVGRSEPGGPVEMSEETWDDQMDVNVKSAFLCCKAVLPIMENKVAGRL